MRRAYPKLVFLTVLTIKASAQTSTSGGLVLNDRLSNNRSALTTIGLNHTTRTPLTTASSVTILTDKSFEATNSPALCASDGTTQTFLSHCIPGSEVPFAATGTTTARSVAARAADYVNVLDYGADPTGKLSSLDAFNAAAASASAGSAVGIVVPRGIYNMSAAFTGNGRNVTLAVAPGTTWTGFNPPYFGPRVDTTANFSHQTNIVLNDTDANATSVQNEYIQENGNQGPVAWRNTWIYVGTPTTGSFWQSIPSATIARWDSLTGPSSYGVAVNNTQALFPLAGTGQGAIAEWNPTNRSSDPGWSDNYGGNNYFGGLSIIPEVDTITGGTHFGFSTQFAFAAVQSSHTNNLGYNPGTYNAFIAYPNSVAPGGRAFYAGGDTTGKLKKFPYAPLEITGHFLHGLITSNNSFFHDGLIISTQTGNSIGWRDGTGTASINGTKLSSGNIEVTLAPAGSGTVHAIAPVKLAGYTVSTLPPCVTAMRGALAYITDALSPAYNASLTGGGAITVPVFCDGSIWTSH